MTPAAIHAASGAQGGDHVAAYTVNGILALGFPVLCALTIAWLAGYGAVRLARRWRP